ncbi:DUF3078 domain-containing protein [Winogradskyella litorisediminis]|uniref:DUF3078 domain-containing protein n=1 Tax=Winogradskyella litorisediminis TaxID=1156618 RepID=A0ABW3N5S5_9FLAO
MKTKLILSVLFVFALSFGFAQTKEELKKQKAEKQAEADKYQAEANELQSQIDALPGWRVGAFGTIGGSFSSFNNWYAQGVPNNSSGTIGFTVNAFANKIEDKYFWRNSLNTNLSWVKFDNEDDPTDDDSFREATDVFSVSSLYGRRLSEKWAVSGLVEYRTTILNNFNNPGYLDAGVGFTWTPMNNLVVVIHPLNYNFVFGDNPVFESSLGAKIVADYNGTIFKDIQFRSNLSVFQSYDTSDLSNWTWINSFSYSIFKNIGVGAEFGLRSNRQEAANFQGTTLAAADNDLQTYSTIGITYKF